MVFSDGSNINFLTIFAKHNFVSSKANLIPRQPLGPCPNGRNAYLTNDKMAKIGEVVIQNHAYGCLVAFASLLKCSGSKTLGLE